MEETPDHRQEELTSPQPTGQANVPVDPQLTFGGVSVGDHFGKLTVLRRDKNEGRHACWQCSCDCGGNVTVRGDRLRNGKTESCGCAQREYQEARLVKVEESVSFKTFGKVFVLGTAREFKGQKQVFAVCACRYCAGTSVQPASDVLRKNFRGCSCRYIGTIYERVRKHGFPPPWPTPKREPIEVTLMRAEWRAMVARCHNPNNRDYPNWGGIGIVVCERWRNSFEAYLEDNGVKPLEKTLDRKDNRGPYSPENCEWATRREQTRNRRNTIFKEYRGDKLTLKELAECLGISYARAYRRHRMGNNGEEIAAWANGINGIE